MKASVAKAITRESPPLARSWSHASKKKPSRERKIDMSQRTKSSPPPRIIKGLAHFAHALGHRGTCVTDETFCTMPIYEYACPDCGYTYDHMQKLADAPIAACPKCGSAKYFKKLSAAGFALKGTGWYVTDFRDGGKKPGETKEGKEGKEGAAVPTPAPAAAPAAAGAPAAASSPTTAPAPAPAPAAAPAPASSGKSE